MATEPWPVVFAAVRPDGGPRTDAMAAVFAWWSENGMPIAYAAQSPGDEPFAKALLYNTATRDPDAEGWDVGIFIDADILPGSFDQIEAAIDVAARSGRLVLAHDHKYDLPEDATRRILAGHAAPAGVAAELDLPYERNTFSSVVVVPRKLWDAVGGFDEGFVGWGWEDLAFFWACRSLGFGYHRVGGAVYHLWHPRERADTYDAPTYGANADLGRRYWAARRRRRTMRALLAERSMDRAL